MEQYHKRGLVPDSKVLDIWQMDVSTNRFLEDNAPVYVITFTMQEVLLLRDRKTRDVVIGAENHVEQCNYAAVVTRMEEELASELTGGWEVIEMRLFFFCGAGMGLMKVSECRWRVGWVAHVYNSAGSLDRLGHYGRRTTPAFGLPPIQKSVRLSLASHTVLLRAPTSHSCQPHRTATGNMYTHVLIHRYFHNRFSATLDFTAIW